MVSFTFTLSRDRDALDSFGMIALSSKYFPSTYVYFKVKDDPEAAMNIKQAETMLGTLRWGAIEQSFSIMSYENQIHFV